MHILSIVTDESLARKNPNKNKDMYDSLFMAKSKINNPPNNSRLARFHSFIIVDSMDGSQLMFDIMNNDVK